MGLSEDIRKAMSERARCPVCALLDDREFDIIARLQHDITRNPEIRQAVAEEGGFCVPHFRQFGKIANAQTRALLFDTMIKGYSVRSAAPLPRCRICAGLAPYEEDLLGEMVRLLGCESFRQEYARRSGLCLPHMQEIQPRLGSSELREWLADVQIEQMRRDLPAINAISTRSYYDTTRPQRESVARQTEKFAGRNALGV